MNNDGLDTSAIAQLAIISGLMKNSKPFPDESWLQNSFLSAAQIATCRSLLLGDDSNLALTVIGLKGLAADLSREGQGLVSAYLDATEQERLDSYAFAKRQREWLGGRIAAKKAALHLLAKISAENAYRSLRVENDPAGRPYLLSQVISERARLWITDSGLEGQNRTAPLPEISISHSGGIAAALAVDRHPCGLDVQKITTKAISVRERFATAAEQAVLRRSPLLQETGEAEALTLLWAVKESLRKAIACHPLLGFSEVRLCQLEGTLQSGMIARCTSPRLCSSQSLPPVFLALSEGYACAITVNRLPCTP